MDVEINKIVEMKNLENLNIVNTNISVLPERFGQLESLETLILCRCANLRALPEGIPARILPLPVA